MRDAGKIFGEKRSIQEDEYLDSGKVCICVCVKNVANCKEILRNDRTGRVIMINGPSVPAREGEARL